MKAVYIHIPFCETICSYCDFCKFYYRTDWCKDYLVALRKEIMMYLPTEPLKTIYIGGGTPSCLSIHELEELFSTLSLFELEEDYEFTVECNIENINEEKLKFLFDHRVNRLSIGIQTFHSSFLTFLNRHHRISEIKEKINLAKEIGFENINVDLIYAFPNQQEEEIKFDLEQFLALSIPHISTYSLMIEPHTILGVKQVEPISEDLDAQFYELIRDTLEEHGYEHYEISNFSLPGYASRHNLTYWNNEEYGGFGLGASGYLNHVRYTNTRNFNQYLKGITRLEEEEIDLCMDIQNTFMLGLRKVNGISKEQFFRKFNQKITDNRIVKKLLEEGKLEETENNIRIPRANLYVENQVLVELIGENDE